MNVFRHPLILDFDGSVSSLDDEQRIPLQSWQEKIRFGCRPAQLQQLARQLEPQLPQIHGCVFMGSGDYHHLTYLLLQRLPAEQKIQLVVCDNHPDNMRYPWGIHCGSWVYWASQLPQIAHIHVLGITSQDIGWQHSWENHLLPLWRGKLTYWSSGVNTRWLRCIGADRASRSFADPDRLIEAFIDQLTSQPLYLSIDKDVLSKQVVQTNWDQGQFQEHHLQQLIAACAGQIIGADVTGEVSDYVYGSRIKRLLSACDGQQRPSTEEINAWQEQQNALNRRLLGYLIKATA